MKKRTLYAVTTFAWHDNIEEGEVKLFAFESDALKFMREDRPMLAGPYEVEIKTNMDF